jgi:hypothetical protein
MTLAEVRHLGIRERFTLDWRSRFGVIREQSLGRKHRTGQVVEITKHLSEGRFDVTKLDPQ